MIAKQLYQQLYQRFDTLTPLPVDCGQSCQSACCQSSDAGEGMYLFPGEEVMFSPSDDWISIQPSDWTVAGYRVSIAICQGSCSRHRRPLACRIFPLVPYFSGNPKSMRLILDPRGKTICPLVRVMRPDGLQPAFYHQVEQCMKVLMKFTLPRAFLQEQSEQLFWGK